VNLATDDIIKTKGEIRMSTNRSYTSEFRVNAVELAKEIGATAAAKQTKVPVDTLYTWIARAKKGDLPQATTPPDPKASLSLAEKVKQLEQENKMLRSGIAQIKRENEILEHASAFFAARLKK